MAKTVETQGSIATGGKKSIFAGAIAKIRSAGKESKSANVDANAVKVDQTCYDNKPAE